MEVWNLYPSGNSGNSYHKQSPKCIYILSITSTCVIPNRACFDEFPILCKDIIKNSYTFLLKKQKWIYVGSVTLLLHNAKVLELLKVKFKIH